MIYLPIDWTAILKISYNWKPMSSGPFDSTGVGETDSNVSTVNWLSKPF